MLGHGERLGAVAPREGFGQAQLGEIEGVVVLLALRTANSLIEQLLAHTHAVLIEGLKGLLVAAAGIARRSSGAVGTARHRQPHRGEQ